MHMDQGQGAGMSHIEGNGTAASQPDLVYPIVYKVVPWARVLTVACALVFGPAWNYMSFRPSYAHGNVVFDPFLMSLDALISMGLVYLIAWAFTARITLYADRFEQHKPFIHRSYGLNDIAGRRFTTGKGAGYPLIEPKNGAAFSIDSFSYGLDERFTRWFMQLPDLQKIERDKHLERVRNDTALGASQDERIAADASRQRNVATASGLLAVAAFALFFMSMRSYEYFAELFIVNALLPWVTFLLMTFYKDQVAGPGGEKLAFLPAAVFAPVLSVGLLATENARLVDPKSVYVWGLVVGLTLCLAGRSQLTTLSKAKSNTRGSIIVILVFLPFAWIYAAGTIALVNRIMDVAPPQIVSATVVGKYIQRGKSSTHYYLRIGGPQALPSINSIRVEEDQYAKAHKGDVACMAIHPGRFGFPWIEVANCINENGSS